MTCSLCLRYQLDWQTDERDVLIPDNEDEGGQQFIRLAGLPSHIAFSVPLRSVPRTQIVFVVWLYLGIAAPANACPRACRGPEGCATDRAQLAAQVSVLAV